MQRSSPWLAMGFRPFFLAAALHAAVFVPWWLLIVGTGSTAGANGWLPNLWHAHEMLFGFTMAVVAGFLLTAARNWTGRDTAHGPALAALLALWLAGRVVMAAASLLPPWLVAATVVSFPLVLAAIVGRVLIAARSRRNYGLLALLAALALASATVHFGVGNGDPLLARQILLATAHLVMLLIVLIGGRVIPLFTRTATRREHVRNVPALDRLALGSSAALAVLAAAGAEGRILAGTAACAGASNLLRMSTWGTLAALRLPMVGVLHAGYAWIGVGQLLLAGAAAGMPIPPATALHALTIGGIGTMTLGMMARVSLGHTGLPVQASRGTLIAFALMTLAALARLSSLVLPPEHWLATVQAAGIAFALAFGLYAAAYARILLRPRADGEAG
jgi:uncharacterized protein involved in response to NO